MDLVSLIHGKWPLRRRLRLLRLARAITLEQLADAQMTVEGLIGRPSADRQRHGGPSRARAELEHGKKQRAALRPPTLRCVEMRGGAMRSLALVRFLYVDTWGQSTALEEVIQTDSQVLRAGNWQNHATDNWTYPVSVDSYDFGIRLL